MYDVKTNSFLTWYEIWLNSRIRNWKRSNSHVDETTGSGPIQCLSVIRKQQSKMIIDRKRLKRNVSLIIVQIKPYFSHKHSSTAEGAEGKQLKRVPFCMFCRTEPWKKWTFHHFRKTFKTCYHCLSLIIGRLYLFDWNLPPMWLPSTLLGLLEVCLPFYPSFPCFVSQTG